MAATKVYKVGETLFIDETGAPKIIKIREWRVDSDATNVYVFDLVADINETTVQSIALSDVQTKAGAAIGGQTQAEVEEYVADPTT